MTTTTDDVQYLNISIQMLTTVVLLNVYVIEFQLPNTVDYNNYNCLMMTIAPTKFFISPAATETNSFLMLTNQIYV